MLAHGRDPARAYRRRLEPRADVDRIFGEPPVAEAPLDTVGRRSYGDKASLRVGGDLLTRRPVGIEAEVPIDGGKAGQHRTVAPGERKEAAGFPANPGVETLEILRQHRGLDHAGKAAVLALPSPAEAEERCT